MDVGFQGGTLTCLTHNSIDFLACFGNDLFNARGMDAPIENKLCQSETSHLSTHGIESRENHRFWRIIDDEINAGSCFQGTNIATLAPNDAPKAATGVDLIIDD